MEKLFSTRDVHQRERFSYWHDVACKNIIEHDSQPECAHSFDAEIEAGTLADMELLLFENSPMKVARTRRNLAQTRTDDLFVFRQVVGRFGLEQEGREVVLEPGDMTLIDPMKPAQGQFPICSKTLILKIRRPELEARVGRTTELVARPLKPIRAESALTSSFLMLVATHVGRMTSSAEQIIRDQTLDLIAVTLGKATEGDRQRLSSAGMFALSKVRAAIESRLTDPALDVEAVAAAAGVSVRYANLVLAQQDTSISRLIRTKRLERCRKALEDPLQDHRTVSEIAYGWGFSDMTHFGRAFRKAYGVPPSEYRQARLP